MSTLPEGCTCTVTLPDLYCPLHKAAPHLLAILEAIKQRASPRSQDFLHPTKEFADDIVCMADAAIAKAEEKP